MFTRLLRRLGVDVKRVERIERGDTIRLDVSLIDMWLESRDKKSIPARVAQIVTHSDGTKELLLTNHPSLIT